MRPSFLLLILVLFSASVFSFSIDSYYTHATVMENGDLQVYENISFTLEQAYNEGFRSIRKEDFGTLENVAVQSVKVNNQSVPFVKQMNGEQAEIVWKKTFVGKNDVELSYVLKNRAALYDDFAKVCFEHYGANWPVSAGDFKSLMTLPEASRGKDMHFEVYSSKKGNAYIDDLTVVIDMTDVPSGNYIGGCYLYDKGALHTTNKKNGSALQILTDERKAYGSEEIIAPEEPGSTTCCCLPVAVLAAILAAYFFMKDRGIPKYPENILPPDKEEPEVVTALVRNQMSEADILAATILDMINKNYLDIVELEKKGESGSEVNREHTILMLKRKPDNPAPKEKAVLDMLFSDGKTEIDLDKMAVDFDAVKDKAGAEKAPIATAIENFTNEIEKVLKEKGVWSIRNSAAGKDAGLVGLAFFGLIVLCATVSVTGSWISGYLASGNYGEVLGTLAAAVLFFPALAYLIIHYRKPSVPDKMRETFGRWDAFSRAVKASRLKEYPPSSAVIWGEILVYATALGMADKVKRHLSELDALTTKRLETLETVRKASHHYYLSAWGVYNLRKYGSRAGPVSRHGGFSSHSSGGWSSGSGGGFSGGSSGGGGFR